MTNCHCCGREDIHTGWCPGCAEDTCAECWKSHLPNCFNAQTERCFDCDSPMPVVASVEDMKGLVQQAFTGRWFCGQTCFDSYRRKEGMPIV